MKYTTAMSLAALAGSAIAFPAVPEMNAPVRRADVTKFQKHEKRLNGVSPGFNAEQQYVSTTGKYAFVAPSASDLRGPCPGLNAMANHGYIPHNGYANIPQFIEGTYDAFGMGRDLGGFLAVYGAIYDGDLTAWSIGGPAPLSISGPLAGLLGTPEGISGSHNKYEADVSPTRGDLFQVGNDYEVVMDQFKGLYEYQASFSNEESNYDLGVLTDYRVKRFAQSTDENPYFFNAPFAGVAVQPAAYTFIYRFMGNKSADHPDGILNQEVLKSFFSITGDYPDFTYTPGHERFPDNWYKRAIDDPYTIPFFLQDLIAEAEQFPQFIDIGGNLGKPNTFTGLDLKNVTGGVYSAQNLLEGNNLSCFLYELLLQEGPDLLDNLFIDTSAAMSKLSSAAGDAFDVGCPQLNSIQQGQFKSQLKQFPGYTKLKADGTY